MTATRERVDISGQFAELQAAAAEVTSRGDASAHGRTQLGAIVDETGRPFQVVVGVFSYQARVFGNPTTRTNRDLVVALERVSPEGGVLPIAYEEDFARLSPSLRESLVVEVAIAPTRLDEQARLRQERERAIVEAPLRYDGSAVTSNGVA